MDIQPVFICNIMGWMVRVRALNKLIMMEIKFIMNWRGDTVDYAHITVSSILYEVLLSVLQDSTCSLTL